MSEFRAPVIEDLSLLCPKCGQVNRCAVAQGGNIEDCWCAQVTMNVQALAGVSNQPRCLCATCAILAE